VLFVFVPLAVILGAVHVSVDALSAGLVILPHALVDVAVCVDQATTAVSHVILPVAFKLSAVWPDLDASSLPESFTRPLSLVDRAIIKLVGTTCD
jgi:hypothetical protein